MERIEWGHGPRVVLVHGDVFDARSTFAALEPLASSYHLVLVNRRGFGSSPDVEGEDFEVDAEDVGEILREEPAHLVGHSYGGVVSLLAAAGTAAHIRSLTVFEPPAFGLVAEDPEVRGFMAQIRSLLAGDPTPDQFLRQFVAAVGGDPGRLPDPLPEPLIRAARVQMRGRWPWEAQIPLPELSAATYPKLVVSGGHSALFDAVCDVLEARLPARREVFAGAGHSIPRLGGPVNDCLRSFWAQATGRAGNG